MAKNNGPLLPSEEFQKEARSRDPEAEILGEALMGWVRNLKLMGPKIEDALPLFDEVGMNLRRLADTEPGDDRDMLVAELKRHVKMIQRDHGSLEVQAELLAKVSKFFGQVASKVRKL